MLMAVMNSDVKDNHLASFDAPPITFSVVIDVMDVVTAVMEVMNKTVLLHQV